jgi:[calcium/calmodulin-dependent protein kinase] kinase
MSTPGSSLDRQRSLDEVASTRAPENASTSAPRRDTPPRSPEASAESPDRVSSRVPSNSAQTLGTIPSGDEPLVDLGREPPIAEEVGVGERSPIKDERTQEGGGSGEAKQVLSPENVRKLEQHTNSGTDMSQGSSRRDSLDTVSSLTSTSSSRVSHNSKNSKHTASVTTSSVSLDGSEYKKLNQYVIIKDLGRGVHAKVSLALNTGNNNLYAIKATNNNVVLAETAVRKEIAVLKKLDHNNVLKLFEVIDDPDNGELLLVLEYCEGGPLYTRYNRDPLSEDVVLKYTRDIIQGLDYIHHVVGIAHMDMKPENLLKSADGTVKIADFGVSFVGKRSDLRAPNSSKRIVGTPAFIAPEMLGDDGYDPYLADIWSLGICIFHMSTAKLPFVGKTIFQIVAMAKRQGVRFPPNPELSVDLMDLLAAILEVEPAKRATVEDIMQHPWITSHGEYPLQSLKTLDERINVTEEEVAAAVRHDPLAALLRPQFKTERFAAGEYIMRKDEIGEIMYFINSGNCEVLMDAVNNGVPSENDTAVLAVRHAGEYVGELSVMETIRGGVGKRSASIRARDEVECLTVTVDALLEALKKDASGRERMIRTASFRLDQNDEIKKQLQESKTQSFDLDVAAMFTPSRTLQVLYAEDSMPTQFIVKRLMKRIGQVNLTCASDGKAALDYCEQCTRGEVPRPDIILMDCQMPVMDGLEATTAIRALDDLRVSKVPIVAVSSGVKSMNQEACMAAGMDDYVSKPLNQVTLTDVLVRNLPPKLLGNDVARDS